MGSQQIGLCIVGCGRIGSVRAHCAAHNGNIGYLAVCDRDVVKAEKLAKACGADLWSNDYRELINKPEINATIVATGSNSAYEPTIDFLNRGKNVLVEKPFITDPDKAAEVVQTAESNGCLLCVGYTNRFRSKFLAAKEQVRTGYINKIESASAVQYGTDASARAIAKKRPGENFALTQMQYVIDLMLWFSDFKKPSSLVARNYYKEIISGERQPVSVWSILQFEDGSVYNLGLSFQLPRDYPAMRIHKIDLFGSNGTISINDDHSDTILYSLKEKSHVYDDNARMKLSFLNTDPVGDLVLGRYYGPMRLETDAFIESVGKNKLHPVLPTGEQALKVLEVSYAMDLSANTGEVVNWPVDYSSR